MASNTTRRRQFEGLEAGPGARKSTLSPIVDGRWRHPGLLARETAERYANWFRTLADPTRVQILALLASDDGPMSVRELTERLPVGQSTVSHQFSALLSAGFVRLHRKGFRSLYQVNSALMW